MNMKKPARIFLSLTLLVLAISPIVSYANTSENKVGNYDPIADHRSVVIAGSARFTILTPQLIRMEWASDGKFEDHASLVFLNRRLSVPEFTHETGADGSTVIRTSALTLTYAPDKSGGKFTAENLSISSSLGGKKIVWKPGTPDTGN